ncbi:MAG: hypothetical protein AAGE94_04545 [Acidobacteriota bacterium]
MIGRLPFGRGPLGPWLAGRDPRRICRHLQLDGWEHLVIADASSDDTDGVLIEIVPDGPWPIAVWTIAYYRQGVDLCVETGDPTEVRGLDTVGVRLVDALPASGRRAVVGSAEGADVQVVASGDRQGFRVIFRPASSDGREL